MARTQRERMLAGELYDRLDPGLVEARTRARDLCQTMNATSEARSAHDGTPPGRFLT